MATPQQLLRAEADGGLGEESLSPTDGYIPTFYVGHHESQRPLPITDFVLRQAQEIGVCSSLLQDRIPTANHSSSMICLRVLSQARISIHEF